MTQLGFALTEKSQTASEDSYVMSLIAAALLLTAFGLVVIYSASAITAFQKFGDSTLFFKKQLFASFVGISLIVMLLRIPFSWLDFATLPLLVLSLVLLLLTLCEPFRYSVNGASRWLRLGFLTFQPAEFTKVAIIMFLSRNIGRSGFNIRSFWRGIFPNLVVSGLCGTLLMLQPDFGSTALIFLIFFLTLFVAGLSYRYIAYASVASLIGVVIAVIKAPYRFERLLSFLDPWRYIQHSGFQIIQSYLGFHNGGLLGLGLGESRQKLYFLPEAHTDFILSVIGEELGLLGVLFVIATFSYIAFIGCKITLRQTLLPRKLLSFGLTSLITLQAAINMCVCMGILPTKGLPLPFVSYGSSSIMMFFVAIALLAKLDIEARRSVSS